MLTQGPCSRRLLGSGTVALGGILAVTAAPLYQVNSTQATPETILLKMLAVSVAGKTSTAPPPTWMSLMMVNRGGDSGPEERFYGGYAPGNNYGGGAAGSESYAASAYYAAAPAGNDYGSDGGYAKGEPVETQAEDPIAEIEDLANIYSSGAAEAARNREPVLSDVSDLEPVYSFSSRSRYLGGRAVFSQTRYTPGEPGALPPMPMSRARRPSMQSRPADPAAKGGV